MVQGPPRSQIKGSGVPWGPYKGAGAARGQVNDSRAPSIFYYVTENKALHVFSFKKTLDPTRGQLRVGASPCGAGAGATFGGVPLLGFFGSRQGRLAAGLGNPILIRKGSWSPMG